MKRFFLLIVLVMLVSWVMASHRSAPMRPAGSPRHWNGPRFVHDGDARRRIAAEARQQTRRALAEARQALDEARDEVRQAFDEARDEVRQAFDEVRVALVSDDDDPPHAIRLRLRRSASAREEAEGLPVPIVPGTRVTEAEAEPPAPPAPPIATRRNPPIRSSGTVASSTRLRPDTAP